MRRHAKFRAKNWVSSEIIQKKRGGDLKFIFTNWLPVLGDQYETIHIPWRHQHIKCTSQTWILMTEGQVNFVSFPLRIWQQGNVKMCFNSGSTGEHSSYLKISDHFQCDGCKFIPMASPSVLWRPCDVSASHFS